MPEATEEADGGAWIWTRRPGSRDMAAWPHLANTVLADSDELRGGAPILGELRSGRKVSFPPSDSVRGTSADELELPQIYSDG